MSLTWQMITENTNEAWDMVMQEEGASNATFFQTRAWASLFAKTFPSWKADPIIYEFSDGNMMVWPMLKHRLTGYRESMIPHVYGGPVFLQKPEKEHLRAFRKIPWWFPDQTLIENPFEPYLREQEGLVRWQVHTSAVDLTPGFDSLCRCFRRNHRQNFKYAVKQGVSVTLANSLEDINAYYDIYKHGLRRWGKNASEFFPRSLFLNMLDMPEFGNSIKMWLAKKDGFIIGGAIILYHGNQTIYWHLAVHSKYYSAHAATFLAFTFIETACKEGYRWFDFMGPLSRAKGVQHFKDGFAIQKLPYNRFYSNNSYKGRIFNRFRHFKENSLRLCPY